MSAASASAAGGVTVLTTLAQHSALLSKANEEGRAVVLLCTAEWHPPCAQMSTVLRALATKQASASSAAASSGGASSASTAGPLFAELDAESASDITELYSQVQAVPTTLVIRGGKVVDTLLTANVSELTAMVAKHARIEKSGASSNTNAAAAPSSSAAAAAPSASSSSTSAAEPAESKESLDARLSKLVRASPVMAFIKGTPEAPRCGFTRKLLELLKEEQIAVGTFDILSDSVVREGLKAFSNWPTYPQLYVAGELVGGLDVVKELVASGELQAMIPAGHIVSKKEEGKDTLIARLQALIKQKHVMLFMKGSPENPQCGFSSKAVALLAKSGCEDYGSFDIFSDEEVREGLKEMSNWPTYPQLYIGGELIGGLDVMQEMGENGELEAALNAPPALLPTQ